MGLALPIFSFMFSCSTWETKKNIETIKYWLTQEQETTFSKKKKKTY